MYFFQLRFGTLRLADTSIITGVVALLFLLPIASKIVADPAGGGLIRSLPPSPRLVKNSHKKMTAKHGVLHFMFLAHFPKFLDPLLKDYVFLARIQEYN